MDGGNNDSIKPPYIYFLKAFLYKSNYISKNFFLALKYGQKQVIH